MINNIYSNGLDGGYWGNIHYNRNKRQELQQAAVAIEQAIRKFDDNKDEFKSKDVINNNKKSSMKFKSPIVTPGN